MHQQQCEFVEHVSVGVAAPAAIDAAVFADAAGLPLLVVVLSFSVFFVWILLGLEH